MSACEWPVDRSCLPDAVTDIDIARQRTAEDLAVAVLWALSGRQFGACPVIVRPCPTPCSVGYSAFGPGFYPVFEEGVWRNVSCGCRGRCSYAAPSVVHLVGPVSEVVEVRIAGVVVPPAEYVLEGDRLIRGGGAVWPSQDLTRPSDEPGTWTVTYRRGVPVPDGVDRLVGVLALEFLNACTGGKCRLPRRVQSVSRNGVSYQMVDPSDIYASGKTGIPEIDLWLASVNPYHVPDAPKVV